MLTDVHASPELEARSPRCGGDLRCGPVIEDYRIGRSRSARNGSISLAALATRLIIALLPFAAACGSSLKTQSVERDARQRRCPASQPPPLPDARRRSGPDAHRDIERSLPGRASASSSRGISTRRRWSSTAPSTFCSNRPTARGPSRASASISIVWSTASAPTK